MSTGRSSCGSLASSAQDNQADSDRECPAGWPQGSAGQASNGCWGRPPGDKPCGQSLTCPQSLVNGIVVNGRRLQWLHGCTGSRDRLAPAALRHQRRAPLRPALAAGGRPAAGPAWHSGGPAAAAGGPATAGSPAGQRRPSGGPIGEPEAAGSARQSRTAVRRQRTRRGTECHGPFESVGPP